MRFKLQKFVFVPGPSGRENKIKRKLLQFIFFVFKLIVSYKTTSLKCTPHTVPVIHAPAQYHLNQQ